MRKTYLVLTFFLFVIISGLLYINAESDAFTILETEKYDRIISLSPSTTEILFALGLGDKIVGVTDFCHYPEQAKKKTKVGGYLNPNFEAIARLQPDMVILLPEQDNVKRFLTELNLTYMTINNKTISDILNGIAVLGKTFAVEQRARELLADIHARTKKIKDETANLPKPKVLISIGRTMGTGTLTDVYAAGKNTFYDQLLEYAGGKNVLTKSNIAYPTLSAEAIIYLNPDVIIDLAPNFEKMGMSEKKLIRDWHCVAQVAAVKNQRVHILNHDYAVVPGPRFILLLEDLVRILHPEISLDQ